MVVFHGSYTAITEIDLTKGRDNLDFGRGFYVTNIRSQAEYWAERVGRHHKTSGVVSEFEFYENAFSRFELKVLRFSGYTEQWLDFVVLNRNPQSPTPAHDYDIVEGPVADDKISRNVTKYLKGKISKDRFLEMLRHSENHQICFCTIQSLQMLDYVENPKDVEYEVSEIGESLLGQLSLDFSIDDETAADKFFSSKTFAQLTDASTGLYKKPWQDIYEMLKAELGNGTARPS